jgi:hypothetical protein
MGIVRGKKTFESIGKRGNLSREMFFLAILLGSVKMKAGFKFFEKKNARKFTKNKRDIRRKSDFCPFWS